jgi:hypothetical protein
MKQNQKTKCTVCPSNNLSSSVSFGRQPPSNRFLVSTAEALSPEDFYELSLGYCKECGTIQLVDRMPVEVIRPRYAWLVYNEPEKHLDDIANNLSGLSGINSSSRFVGVTCQDEPILDRMRCLGFSQTACISEDDLKCPVQPFGMETIQEALSSDSTVMRLREFHGNADMILARYIIEHATDAGKFVRSLRGLLNPVGYMMLELPDCEKIFRSGNHAFIWEEHISYFTEASVSQLAKAVGAKLVWLKRFSSTYEDTLNVLLYFNEADEMPVETFPPVPDTFGVKLDEFATSLKISCKKWREQLETYHRKGEKVALFGAGHLAAKFINFYGLADLIDCVIDDHPKKIGLVMPGSGLEVVSSAELLPRSIKVCISTLNPESEIKVRGKLSSFFDAGGCFIPAFATV